MCNFSVSQIFYKNGVLEYSKRRARFYLPLYSRGQPCLSECRVNVESAVCRLVFNLGGSDCLTKCFSNQAERPDGSVRDMGLKILVSGVQSRTTPQRYSVSRCKSFVYVFFIIVVSQMGVPHHKSFTTFGRLFFEKSVQLITVSVYSYSVTGNDDYKTQISNPNVQKQTPPGVPHPVFPFFKRSRPFIGVTPNTCPYKFCEQVMEIKRNWQNHGLPSCIIDPHPLQYSTHGHL
jgi:hypothetical protein